MQAVVLIAVLEKLDDARTLKVCGATAAAVEVATHSAGNAVLINLAYVYEEVTVLSAAVEQFLEYFGGLREVRSEASCAEETEASRVAWWKINAHLQPLHCTEMRNSHIPSWGNAFGISVFTRSPVFSAAASKLARQNPLHGSPFMPASLSALCTAQAEA